MYPPKPVKPEVKSDVSSMSGGSSTSEPIDLTLDDDGDVKVAARTISSTSNRSSSSDGDDGSVAGLSAEEEIVRGTLRCPSVDYCKGNIVLS